MLSPRPRRLAAVALAAALLSACGSTVPQTTTLGPGGQAAPTGDGLSLDAGAVDPSNGLPLESDPLTGPAQDSGGGGGVAPGDGAASSAGGSGGSGATTGTDSAPRPQPAAPGAAVSRPIQMGFMVPKADRSEAAAAFGVSNGNTVGPRGMTFALVKALNAQGGLAGRQIQPVYAVYDNAGENYDAQYQSACSTFLQDNKVEAVLTPFSYAPVLHDCLRKAGVPLVLGQLNTTDTTNYAKGGVYSPYGLSDDARYRLVLEHHTAAGFLTRESRIGVLRGGCANDGRAYERTVVPTMKRLGLQQVALAEIRCLSGFSDAGGAVSELQAAVLQFRQNQVDRVVIVGNDEANGVFLFSQQAESQGYRPGYAVSSNVAPAVTRGNMPAAQARNIRGVGWNPSLDHETAYQPTAVEKRCLDTLAAQDQAAATATDRYFSFIVCGGVFFYEAALKAAGGQSSGSAIAAAVDGFGTSYRAPGVLSGATRLGSGRPYGPASARTFAFAGDCGCFRFSGAARPIA